MYSNGNGCSINCNGGRFASLRAEALTDKAEIEEFKEDLKKAKHESYDLTG